MLPLAIQPNESIVKIFKEFTFEAAHHLPNVPDEHKCRRLHGHSFRVRINVVGNIAAKSGWVMDFADIASVFKPIWAQLDHYYLNDIPGLENPTSENIAIWIWHKLKPELSGLDEIEVFETCTSGCSYRGGDY